MLVLFKRVLNDFNSQSNFTNLTEYKYLKEHFIKIFPTDCFACVAHQETQHPKKAILIMLNKNKISHFWTKTHSIL